MKVDKETTTLRIPIDILEEMRKEATKVGTSLNDYMLTAMYLGRKALNGPLTFSPDALE